MHISRNYAIELPEQLDEPNKLHWSMNSTNQWGKRKMAEYYRIMRSLGRSWACPKQRNYFTLVAALPSAEEWNDVWPLPGPQEGMSAYPVEWSSMLAEHQSFADPLPPLSMNHTNDAWRDVKRRKHHVLRAGRRKSAPLHSIPTEILTIILTPDWQL